MQPSGLNPSDFGRSEGAAGQRRRTALLHAPPPPPDFQTLPHACYIIVCSFLISIRTCLPESTVDVDDLLPDLFFKQDFLIVSSGKEKQKTFFNLFQVPIICSNIYLLINRTQQRDLNSHLNPNYLHFLRNFCYFFDLLVNNLLCKLFVYFYSYSFLL